MGNDFRRICQAGENRKVVWLVGLVLASVLVVQYFELPNSDSIVSLLSYGKAYFSFSDINGDSKFQENRTYFNSSSSPRPGNGNLSEENVVLEQTIATNHSEEVKNVNRSISLAPEKAMSDVTYKYPQGNFDKFAFPPKNAYHDTSVSMTRPGYSFEPVIAPSRVVSSIDTNAGPMASVVTSSAPTKSPPLEETPTRKETLVGENARLAISPTSPDDSFAPVAPSQSVSRVDRGAELGSGVIVSSPPTIMYVNRTIQTSNSTGSTKNVPPPKETTKSSKGSVVSLHEMYDMLLQSRLSNFSKKNPLWPSPAEQDLLDARKEIENAAIIRDHPGLYAPIYRNLSTFIRSYEIMEQKLKVYIYKDGKRPVFHQGRLKGIYASEGWFMKLMEANGHYITRNPAEAHLFYMPFSSQVLVEVAYVPDSQTFKDTIGYLKNYLDTIKSRYPFWNRTDGADHFLVACHDWAPIETRRMMANCIRALCNSDVKEGFHFGQDVSLPETYVQSSQNPSKETGGAPPSKRTIFAFFAGKMHGYLRPVLLQHWENKDPEMKIFGRLGKSSYKWHMKNTKYCICAKGYEVNSPRVVEAIMYGCVPVIISDNFVPPFFEILDWNTFAVFVPEKDIPNLKNILLSVPERRYRVMQSRVKMVRQHFLWHDTPVKYDIFHMILHSVWLNRVLRLSPR